MGATVSGATSSYVYTPFGMRRFKTVSGTMTDAISVDEQRIQYLDSLDLLNAGLGVVIADNAIDVDAGNLIVKGKPGIGANDAAGAMTRLLDMGVEDYLLTSTICGVMGQRLVRRLCEHCRQPYTPLADAAARIFRNVVAGQIPTLYRPVGCAECQGSGYRGRTTIAELLEVADPIRRLVLQKAETQDIQRAAVAAGMRSMFRHGLAKAIAGETSLEEVLRVTQEA